MQTANPISARRAAILDVLEEGPVRNQSDLGAALAERGIEVNQATLSRDLRALGVVKGPGGYRLPSGGPAAADPMARMRQALREWLGAATPAQNLLVLRTPPGGAQPLAFAIDNADVEGILGTVAGDDTILIVAPDARTAQRLASEFERAVA